MGASTAFASSLYRSGLWIFDRLRKLLAGGGVSTSAGAGVGVDLVKLVGYYGISNSGLALMSPKASLESLSKDLS